MRLGPFRAVACIMGMSVGCAVCTSSRHSVPLKDAAIDSDSSAQPPDAGVVYVLPPHNDGGMSTTQGCGPPIPADCPTIGMRYYFESELGKCVAAQGCAATGSTYASVAECETTCIRFLHCSCAAGVEQCPSEGLCGTCPSPDMFDDLTDTASGLPCPGLFLTCRITTADEFLWNCVCLAGANSIAVWQCVRYMGP